MLTEMSFAVDVTTTAGRSGTAQIGGFDKRSIQGRTDIQMKMEMYTLLLVIGIGSLVISALVVSFLCSFFMLLPYAHMAPQRPECLWVIQYTCIRTYIMYIVHCMKG